MKKKVLVLEVLAVMVSIGLAAKEVKCIDCGKVIETRDRNEAYHDSARKGYRCHMCNLKNAPSALVDALSGMAEEQRYEKERQAKYYKHRNLCKKACEFLKVYLPDCTKKNVPVATQAKKIKSLLAQTPALEIWSTVISYGSMDLIRYCWPDPADKVVYKASKDAAKEYRENPGPSAVYWFTTDPVAAISGDAPPSEAYMVSVKDRFVAFALGLSLADNSIRYVAREDESEKLMRAVVLSGREDVLQYFMAQCGNSYVVRGMIRAQIRGAFYVSWNEQKRLEGKKESLKQRLAKAEDEEARNTVQKSIDAVDREIVSKQISVPENVLKYFMPEADLMSIIVEISRLDSNPSDIYVEEEFLKVAQKVPNKIGEWAKWRTAFNAAWTPKTHDAFCPYVVADDRRGQWIADTMGQKYVMIPNFDGVALPEALESYPSSGAPHSMRYGYVIGSNNKGWMWKAGLTNPQKPGYVSAAEEGKWVWSAGIFGAFGLISGAKEGEWGPAPGFTMKDGKAVWTAGQVHPNKPGLVSDKAVFSWVPDAKHLWKDPKNAKSLEIQEDYQELSTIGKICLIPVAILLRAH